jgi:Uma2 family endonuclease
MPIPRHQWTAEDVQRMVETGVLAEDAPVELIDGDLITVSPQGPQHRMSTVRVRRCLERAFGPGFYVQTHSPVQAGPNSLPEPDVAVVREPERFDRHPRGDDVALVLELAYSSHDLDRAKAAVYAAGGFPEYWIVDLVARRVTVYRQPDPTLREYRVTTVFTDGEVLSGAVAVPVADLLPPAG